MQLEYLLLKKMLRKFLYNLEAACPLSVQPGDHVKVLTQGSGTGLYVAPFVYDH